MEQCLLVDQLFCFALMSVSRKDVGSSAQNKAFAVMASGNL
jgi:hypothetical protein